MSQRQQVVEEVVNGFTAQKRETILRIGATIRRVAALNVAIEYEMLELGKLPVRSSFEGALNSRIGKLHDAARELQRFFIQKSKSKEQFDAFVTEYNSSKLMLVSAILQILLQSDEESVEQVFEVLSDKWNEQQEKKSEEPVVES
jgi:hypothetical protein